MDKKDLLIYGCVGLVCHHNYLEHHETLAGLVVPRPVGYMAPHQGLMPHGAESSSAEQAIVVPVTANVTTGALGTSVV